jgi:hypothetical protein
MNIGLEDIAVLMDALAESGGEIGLAALHFSRARVPDVHAAVKLSVRASKVHEALRFELILAGGLRRMVHAIGLSGPKSNSFFAELNKADINVATILREHILYIWALRTTIVFLSGSAVYSGLSALSHAWR